VGAIYHHTVGFEQLLNAGQLRQSLDAKSSKSIGATGTISVGVDTDFAVSLYYSSNKTDGINKQYENLKKEMGGFFLEIFKGVPVSGQTEQEKSENFTKLIYKNLQEKFPGTNGDTLYEMSKRIHDMFISYQQDVHLVDKNKLATTMAKNLANYRRNNNLQDLNGKLYLSKVGVGTAFLKSFAGFLGIVNVGFTHISNVTFEEEQASYQQARKYLERPDYYTALDGLDKENPETITDKLNTLLLGQQIFTYDNNKRVIVLDVKELKLIQKKEGSSK
jgi:hypothetical protein